jgi:hypothetical protein
MIEMMMLKIDNSIWSGLALLALLASLPAWSQATPPAGSQPTGSQLASSQSSSSEDDKPNVLVPAARGPLLSGVMNDDTHDDRMLAPPPVSGANYPTSFTSEERSNYLRGGVTFNTAYSDNVLGATTSAPVSDVSYSVWPTIALDATTPRLHTVLTYAPGFTFYQRTSARNEADQNAVIDFDYRLSPHVTFSARDGFQKSSNVFNQPDLGSAGIVSGGTQEPNDSVIAPLADRLSNNGNVGITYQFAANEMAGASGAFTNLHYPDETQVPGLFDSSSQGGRAFYSLRLAKKHYVGVSYQYQRLLSYPNVGQNETQTHTVLFFYTVNPTSRSSISLFGGPQHSDTVEPYPSLPLRTWTPAAGASLSWQSRLTSFAVSYAHLVTGGGGLIGAVESDSAIASLRQQMTKMLSGSVSGLYAQNNILGGAVLGASNGHTVSGTASLQQLFGQHLSLQLGYTRLHQDYSTVAVLAVNPDTNREFVAITYQFARPLGR